MTIVVGALLAALMAAVAVSDWRRYRVPDALNGLALALRVLDILIDAPAPLAALGEAGLRAGAIAGLFYMFRAAYSRWRGREGMGLGDVKLAAVAGAWVDWPLLPYVVEGAALFGLALVAARSRSAGMRPRADTKLPFALGFGPAIFVGWQMQVLGF